MRSWSEDGSGPEAGRVISRRIQMSVPVQGVLTTTAGVPGEPKPARPVFHAWSSKLGAAHSFAGASNVYRQVEGSCLAVGMISGTSCAGEIRGRAAIRKQAAR